jgi:thioesterase domain-containing protein
VNAGALQAYLHEHIPLSKAMGVQVVNASVTGVTLAAPLAPNINHRETVFGGSASAVAILSAWALLYLRLTHEQLHARLVIQKNTMTYEQPIPARFTTSSTITDTVAWDRFVHTLRRRGRARITVESLLYCNGAEVGKLEGDFVALTQPVS